LRPATSRAEAGRPHHSTPANEYEAARIGAPGIEAFVRAGGKFTDKPNEKDLTSAMIAATSGPDAINAFTEREVTSRIGRTKRLHSSHGRCHVWT